MSKSMKMNTTNQLSTKGKHSIRKTCGWAAVLMLGLCTALALGQEHFGGRLLPQPHAGGEWSEFNVHDYGVGLRLKRDVPIPGLPMPVRIRAVDLGPDVVDMKADIQPVNASVWVNGAGPLEFDPVTSGVLEVSVPRRLLNRFMDNHFVIRVWGPSGEELVDFVGELPSGL